MKENTKLFSAIQQRYDSTRMSGQTGVTHYTYLFSKTTYRFINYRSLITSQGRTALRRTSRPTRTALREVHRHQISKSVFNLLSYSVIEKISTKEILSNSSRNFHKGDLLTADTSAHYSSLAVNTRSDYKHNRPSTSVCHWFNKPLILSDYQHLRGIDKAQG